MRAGVVVVCGILGVGLAACGGSTARGASSTTTSTAITTSAPPGSASTSVVATTAPSSGTRNLVVTDDIRSQLVAAGAQLNSLSANDYTGLRAGETFYAYDRATQTYWAGAGLDPSSSSTRAQIAAQDDGAYLLFERPASGAWKAYAVGLAGTEGATCPVQVPAAVLQLWDWAPGSCRPRTIL
jgi:hypothetical protein